MKINIEVDITPEEMRKLMGWPDVEKFQQDLMEKIQEKMHAGAEGYDPMSLMQPLLDQSFNSMDSFQKIMAGMMGGNASKKGTD